MATKQALVCAVAALALLGSCCLAADVVVAETDDLPRQLACEAGGTAGATIAVKVFVELQLKKIRDRALANEDGILQLVTEAAPLTIDLGALGLAAISGRLTVTRLDVHGLDNMDFDTDGFEVHCAGLVGGLFGDVDRVNVAVAVRVPLLFVRFAFTAEHVDVGGLLEAHGSATGHASLPAVNVAIKLPMAATVSDTINPLELTTGRIEDLNVTPKFDASATFALAGTPEFEAMGRRIEALLKWIAPRVLDLDDLISPALMDVHDKFCFDAAGTPTCKLCLRGTCP